MRSMSKRLVSARCWRPSARRTFAGAPPRRGITSFDLRACPTCEFTQLVVWHSHTLAALSCQDIVRSPSCLSLWHAPSSLHAVCRTEPSGIRNAQARTGTVMELLNAWHVRRREQQRRDREAETERVLVRNQELNARCAPLLLCTRYTLAPLHVQLVRATLSSLAGRAAFVYHVFSGERRRSGLWRRRGCSSRKSSAKRTTRLLLSFALRVNAAVPPPPPLFLSTFMHA